MDSRLTKYLLIRKQNKYDKEYLNNVFKITDEDEVTLLTYLSNKQNFTNTKNCKQNNYNNNNNNTSQNISTTQKLKNNNNNHINNTNNNNNNDILNKMVGKLPTSPTNKFRYNNLLNIEAMLTRSNYSSRDYLKIPKINNISTDFAFQGYRNPHKIDMNFPINTRIFTKS